MTGKKARKAPRSTTDNHRGHCHPNGCSRPLQLTTSGARAISGTVWDTIRYGSRPRRTTLKRAISTARPTPTVAPIGESEQREAERVPHAGEDDAPDLPARGAALGVEEASDHVPDVGHRRCGSSWAGCSSRARRRRLRVRATCTAPTPAATITRATTKRKTFLTVRASGTLTSWRGRARRWPASPARRRPAACASLASCWR